MRFMLAIVALAAAAWTGWWFFVAHAKERALEDWLAERRADGWVAEAAAIEVAGFPYRVDTTVRGLELADPEAGWSWSAPTFQFLTLAYQPNHLIAVWPDRQTVATPLGSAEVRAGVMRGSLVVEPNAGLALQRSTVDVADLALALPDGREIAMTRALLSTRQAEGDAPPFAHDLSFSADGLALPEDWLRGVDRAGVLGPTLETARLEAQAVFDRPWDRAAVEGDNPALTALVVRDLAFAWGRLDLRGQGELTADPDGYAEGRIDLRARNWREMLDLAADSGALASGVASALRGGLGLLARLGGDENSLEAPLEFADGRVYLGPVPIGSAPRMTGAAR